MTTPIQPRVVPPRGPARIRRSWDIVLSVLLLLGSYGAFFIGLTIGLVSVAVTAECRGDECDLARAASGGLLAFAAGIALFDFLATIGTILLLVYRRLAWWLPATALGVTILGWIVAIAVFANSLR